MDISKQTILRLAKEAGLSEKGAAQLERDLDLFAEGQASNRPIPTWTSTLGNYTPPAPEKLRTTYMNEAAPEKMANGHG